MQRLIGRGRHEQNNVFLFGEGSPRAFGVANKKRIC